MNKIFVAFFLKLTFQRQLGITVTLGILMLALFSSVVGSWQGNERVRSILLEQGRRITENLARQSTLALIYASADNAADAASAPPEFSWSSQPGNTRCQPAHLVEARGY